MTFNEILEALIEKRNILDKLRDTSPSIAEALKISDEYHGLMQELQKFNGTTQYIPMPYPVQPAWQPPYKITVGDSTSPERNFTTNAKLY